MTEKLNSRQQLLNETRDLRARLEVAEEIIRAIRSDGAEEILRAIRSGEVDALMVAQSEKLRALLLTGADYPYQAMVESMGEGAVTLIPDGTIFFCNSRFVEIVQTPLENLIGTPFQRLIPPEEQAQFGEILKNSVQNIVKGEFRLQTPQGMYVPVQLSAHILEAMDVKGITVVVTDLSDLKQAEQAQWEAEHKLERMLQSLADGMIVVDLSGKFTYANPAAERILGVQKDQIIGNYYNSGKLKQIDANSKLYSLDQLPLAIALREQREVNSLDLGIIVPGGETKWLSVNASPLLNDKGQIFGAISSFRDISEQKKGAEVLHQLHERNALQASLLDQVRNAVIATDLEGKIFYWNKFAQTLYQWTAEEVIGRPIQEVTVPEVNIGVAEEILQSLQQIGYWEGEFLVNRKDGSLFPAHVSDTLIKDDQGVAIGIVGVSIDISERIQAEEAVRTSEGLYRSLFENMLEGFAYHKMLYENNLPQDYIFLEVNKRFEQITGLENVVGKKVSEVLPGIQSKNRDLIEIYGRVAITGKPEKFESYIEQLGKWFSISVYSPEKEYFVAVFDNITERKQAEETLKHSETRYRRLFEAAQDGVILLNAANGEIFDVNPFLVHMLGYSFDELIGKKLWDIVAFKDVEASQLAFLELQENEYIRYEDIPLRSKDGHFMDVEFVSNVYWADQKKVIQCNVRDITERKRAAEEIRTRTQELNMLYGLSRSLADAANLDQVFDIVNHHCVDNVHVTFSRIGLLEDENLVIRSAYPMRVLDHDLFIGDSKPISALPSCQRVLKGRKPVILRASDPKIGDEEKEALLLDHVRSICLMPLRLGKTGADSWNFLGVLMLGEARAEDREPISPQKLSLIGGIGAQAASAIRRMLLRQETDRRLQHLSALSEIDRAITSSVDLNASLKTVLDQVRIQLGVDAADVLLLNPSSHLLEFISGQGFRTKAVEGTRLRLGESHAGRAALERVIVHGSNLRNTNDGFLIDYLALENFVSYYGVPLISKGKVKGVLEIFNRTPLKPDGEWLDFLKALAEQAAIAVDNAMLFDGLTRSNIELALAYTDTIEGWSRALDLRDKETEGHTLRVTEKTQELARSFGMNQDELVQIRWGSLLHDIGKMGVPDGILLKPGPLTEEEWVLMRKHPTMAYELLSPIHYLRHALDIPYCHHEKWDGSGYPRGLKGEQIPLAARIFAIVDVWDALLSDRPYRPAWTTKKTIEHIKAGSGTHFDPGLVDTILLDLEK